MKVKELMLKCEGLEQRNLEMIDEKWELRGKLRKAEAKLEKYEWALDVKQKYIEKVEKENEQLRTQLMICQQSNDDGRFQVWQVPPIPKGMRITITTTGENDE